MARQLDGMLRTADINCVLRQNKVLPKCSLLRHNSGYRVDSTVTCQPEYRGVPLIV